VNRGITSLRNWGKGESEQIMALHKAGNRILTKNFLRLKQRMKRKGKGPCKRKKLHWNGSGEGGGKFLRKTCSGARDLSKRGPGEQESSRRERLNAGDKNRKGYNKKPERVR